MGIRLFIILLFCAGHSIAQEEESDLSTYCAMIQNDTTELCISLKTAYASGDKPVLSAIARESHSKSLELLKLAKYHESILYNELASKIWLELDSMERHGYATVYISRAHYRLGNIYEAFRNANLALSIAETRGYPVLKSLAHRFLSWDYWRIKQCDDALFHIAKFREAIENGVIPQSSYSAYFNARAKFESCKGNIALAIEYADSTYDHALKNGDARTLSLALSNKVNYLYQAGTFEERFRLTTEALDISQKMNDKEQYASNLGLLGNVYCRDAKYEEAIPPGLESLKIASEIQDKPRMIVAYKLLSRAYAGVGDYKRALEYELLAEEMLRQIYGLKSLDRIFALEKEKTRALQEIEIQQLSKEREIHELNLKQEKQVYIIVAFASFFLLIIALWSWYKYRQSKEKETWMLKEMYEGELKKHELRSLRAMMNPHFIFNSLNSIKSYIIGNESRMATDYLNKFSDLIRRILNNSRLEQITLDEELNTLDLYIQMESMRLEGKFEYQITCGPEVDKHRVMIAPLIIQPFVENAIWHGLVNKEGDRLLKIDVYKNKEGVAIHVLDNGIGRAKARSLSDNNPLKRKSFGINITENRIKFLSSNNPVKNSLHIVDLVDNDGHAIGTEVIIQINS